MTKAPEKGRLQAPYYATWHDGFGGKWLTLNAHGMSVASFSVQSWGSEHACIDAAWEHAYGDDPTAAAYERGRIAGLREAAALNVRGIAGGRVDA